MEEKIEVFVIPTAFILTDKKFVVLRNTEDGFIAVAGDDLEEIIEFDVLGELEIEMITRAEE